VTRIAVLGLFIGLAFIVAGCKKQAVTTKMTAPMGKHIIAVYDEKGNLMVRYHVDAQDQFGLPKSAVIVHHEGGGK
jgi:hypothetical protein